MRRGARAAVAALVALLPLAAARADAASDVATLHRRALAEDAAELSRFAEWAEHAGLERRALEEWERVLVAAPDHAVARKRLAYVRRGNAWFRDPASLALVAPSADSKPGALAEALTKRVQDVERPSSARHRQTAAKAFALGVRAAGEEELRLAARADPSDVWSRVALGLVADREDGWIDEALRRRRDADARAAAEASRLRAARTDPVALVETSTRDGAAGTPLAVWRLREWRLETDLPAADAAEALAAADLAGRWFRETFGVEPGTPVLPGEGTFVILSTDDAYRRVIEGEPSLSSGERTFAAGLGAFPLRHARDKGPWVVIAQRPDGPNAADVCLHYAVHLLAQARFHVEAQEAWLYEGLAAYADVRLLGFHGTWCIRLEDTSAHPEGLPPSDPSQWPGEVERAVAFRDDFPLRGLVGVSINGLDAAMLAKSWSLLRWLLEEHDDEARDFFEARRAGLATPAALLAATGLSLDDLDEAWHATIERIGAE